jgi:hypothetical protein
MKRIVWVFSIIIFLFSCKKNLTETEEIMGVSKSTHGKYEQPCRVDYMIMSVNDTAFFTYTPWGDPDKIEMSTPGIAPSYYFTYDKNKRLVEVQSFWYKDEKLDAIRQFYYQGNRVVMDSVFSKSFNSSRIGKYVYDKYDRVIEYNYIARHYDDFSEVSKDTIKYFYRAENPYIENRNYLAGNRVLMFLHKYYNKTSPASFYNSFGYPTLFAEFQVPSLFCCFGANEIVYDCSGSRKTQEPTQ